MSDATDAFNTVILLFVVVTVLVLAAAAFGITRMVHSAGVAQRPRGGEWVRADRRWWGSPLVWLGVCAVFAALSLWLAPGLLGGFIFLPFVWLGGKRWKPIERPGCRSCSRPVEPGHAFCPSCGTPVA